MYGESAATAPTVVTSSTKTKVVAALFFSVLQSVNAAIMLTAVLFVPAKSPGLPPVAVMYTYGSEPGHVYNPVRVNDPFAPVVTVASEVAATPSPVDATAHSFSVAPVNACWPPWTTPCKPRTAGAGVLVGLETFPALQPERRTTRRNPRDPDNLRMTAPNHLTRLEKTLGNLF